MQHEFSQCPMLRDNSSLKNAPCSVEMINDSYNQKILLCKVCGKHESIDLDRITQASSGNSNLISFIVITLIVLIIAGNGQSERQPQPSQYPQLPQSSQQ